MRHLPELLAEAAASFNPASIALAFVCVAALAGVALSLFATVRSKAMILSFAGRAKAEREQYERALDGMRQTLELLAAQLNEVQKENAIRPAIPKPGFNLNKRSQAIRMHRRGEPPEQIAAALEVPLQEIDLLLKVHRMVINNL